MKNSTLTKHTLFYGWVIVTACTVLQIIQFIIQYSFSVFFKPLIAQFDWSRAATSGAYSLLMISAGTSSIPLGWLADRIGPRKVVSACGFVIGLALLLTSKVSELWQFYLTFGFILGIGMGGTFAIATGVTARWFIKRRGLAMGVVSAGIGLGTLFGPPVSERLISTIGWSQAYFFIGIAAWVVMIGSALFLRRDPKQMGLQPYGADSIIDEHETDRKETIRHRRNSFTMRAAFRSNQLWRLVSLMFVFNICVQLIMVHLVNYATDLGIAPFAAATIVSVIGIGSIAGRLIMGNLSDRIGSINVLIISCTGLAASLIWLIFSRQLWTLYLFAVFFSFAYGGEVTLMPLLTGEFFGLQAVMALTGALSAGARVGGALGSWLGGKIFDMTHSYSIAFTITALAGIFVLTIAITLKRAKKVTLS